MQSVIFIAVLATCCLSALATVQNITVKGVAVCNKKRLGNVHVQLLEKDALVDPDDLLAETRTNSEGEFQLYGEHDEVGTIEPFVRITHNCFVTKPGCMRVSDYYVPTGLLGGVYDMTYTTLDIVVQGESEKCE